MGLSKTCQAHLCIVKPTPDKYNMYVSLTGRHKGVRGQKQQHHLLTNKTLVVDLLSDVSSGKDCLFAIIDDIVSICMYINFSRVVTVLTSTC